MNYSREALLQVIADFVHGMTTGQIRNHTNRMIDKFVRELQEHNDAMRLLDAKGYDSSKTLLEIVNDLPLVQRKPSES